MMLLLLSLLCKERDEPLGIILKRLPKKNAISKRVKLSFREKKARLCCVLLQNLAEITKKQSGLFYRSNEAFAYLQPDEIRPVIYLTVEGNTMEIANELATRIGDMLL